jgi:hypothetical protein
MSAPVLVNEGWRDVAVALHAYITDNVVRLNVPSVRAYHAARNGRWEECRSWLAADDVPKNYKIVEVPS